MNRKKIIGALSLLNAAVLLVAIMTLPRRGNYSFTYTDEFDRAIKRFIHSVPWGEVLGILVISALVSAAIYLFVTGLRDNDSSGPTAT